MSYQFAAYDVIQVCRDGRWLDFSTIRTEADATNAKRLVDTGYFDGQLLDFRIVRKGEVVYPEPVSQSLIDAVKRHALDNYEAGGWDVIVECWDDKQIAEWLGKADVTTPAQAIKSFAPLVDVWKDRQDDARNSQF